MFWLRLIFGSKEKESLMSNRVVFKYTIYNVVKILYLCHHLLKRHLVTDKFCRPT